MGGTKLPPMAPMKPSAAGVAAVMAQEFTELALGLAEHAAGFDTELFTGIAEESEEDRAARLAVARDALAELREVDPVAAAYARALLRASDLPKRAPRPRLARKATPRRTAVQRAAVAA
ncbi:hypothetical protein [Streptomyces sp. KN37]|uniref:hypothetical protein n=1 Tax=Streptomyces sp. KN37 TaxID=3090667 RepID=UPI002A747723|nr:hypothetical protein [Streptomyces sp. KN37]WPO73864.1 hypothetical protein R9806_26190 [Streptomyces sp. KN37]